MPLADPVPDPPSTLRTRPSLLFRLRDWKDEASWTEFYRLYYNYVYGCARRSRLSHADAQEVTQDVFKRVAETIHEFESDPARGSFRGWLLNLTRWRIVDKVRMRKPHEKQESGRRDHGEVATLDGLADDAGPSLAWDTEWRHHLVETALARLARRVPAKHFQIFNLYRRQEWPVLRIARELGVNPASVYLISHRLTKQLRAEVAELESRLS